MDQGKRKFFIDFVSQGIDMDIHHVADAVEVNVPHVFGNHGAGDGAAGIAHQELQERIFPGLQFDRLSATLHRPGNGVDLEIREAQTRIVAGPAPQESSDSGGEFDKRKRFNQVIVSTGVEAENPVFSSPFAVRMSTGILAFF